ncbi:MAG: hypothetical protein E6833_36040, partial [Bradyrhizobium sp.]|nr:hypothetical protein [Bradyrhizobium sp.]
RAPCANAAVVADSESRESARKILRIVFLRLTAEETSRIADAARENTCLVCKDRQPPSAKETLPIAAKFTP